MPEVIYQDSRLAVLNKPANVSLLADRSGAACLWDTLPESLGCKPYLVHRLDKGTSGVLLVALNQAAQRELTRAFRERRVRKFYLAWVTGEPPRGHTLSIDLPLRQGRKRRFRVAGARAHIRRSESGWSLPAPDPRGFPSFTRIRALGTANGQTLLLAFPATGRTHQLRVHLSWIGHPILGDHLYGQPAAPEQRAPRLMLHCHRLVVPGWGSFGKAVDQVFRPL